MQSRFEPKSFASALEQSTQTTEPLRLKDILAEGSKSFHMASKLLPFRIREPVTALYAFCRIADDMVDDAKDSATALETLHGRLDDLYAGRLTDHPLDAAFHRTVSLYCIPRAVILAMFEGFKWDNEGRRYQTIDDTMDYCARVASTVGVMMSLIMGERRPAVLARACDLGLAMQLVNICRDVGEDADRGRLYLPTEWLVDHGIDGDQFLAHPSFSKAMGEVVRRMLSVASHRFALADIGIGYLPKDVRLSIRAAALIYADIARVIRCNQYDSISTRAHTSKLRKIILAFRAAGSKFWREEPNTEPPHPSVTFLIDAVVSTDQGSVCPGMTP